MKKLGILVLTLVLALGAIGVGYAAWSQPLTIGANVTAASFDVNFTLATSPDAPLGGTATNVITGGVGKEATITLTNAYPNYEGDFMLTVTNNGSVPVTLVLTGGPDSLGVFSASDDPDAAIPAGGTFVYTITATVPDWVDAGNSGASASVTYTIVAAQAT